MTSPAQIAQLRAVQGERRAAEQALYGARTEADVRGEAQGVLSELAAVEARRQSDPPPAVTPVGVRPAGWAPTGPADPHGDAGGDDDWLRARAPAPVVAAENPVGTTG